MSARLCLALLLLPYHVESAHHFGARDRANHTYTYWEWDTDAGGLTQRHFRSNSTEPSLTLSMDIDVAHHSGRAAQDKVVQSLVNGAGSLSEKPRFFVDLAANHYAQYSNTFKLERDHKWIGICIEPNPLYTAGLLANRQCKLVRNVVTAVDGDTVEFKMTDGQGGIVGSNFDNHQGGDFSTKIVGVNLNTILEHLGAPKVIEYLSLDVEGAETYVLQSFDFSKHVFLIMTVERPKKDFHALVTSNGYWWVNRLEITGEMLYVHESIGNFDSIMQKMRGIAPVHKWSPHGQPHEYLLAPVWPPAPQ